MKFKTQFIAFIFGITVAVGIMLTLFAVDGVVLVTKHHHTTLTNFYHEYAKLDEIKDDILDRFYMDINESELNEGMIDGMFEATDDRYSRYMNAEEFEEYKNSTDGNYVGIGILSDVSENEIHITRVFPNSPAEGAGILPGDYVLAVDGEHIDDVGSERLINIMLGEANTPVEVVISRNSEELAFHMKRGKVEIPFITSTIIGDLGYISIYQFGTDTSKAFLEHLNQLKSQNIKGLIIDVRDNPGGLVVESTAIADEFLGKGIIIYTLDNEGKKHEYKSDRHEDDIPIVMLANGQSASASEILLASLKDYDRIQIVGEKTFCKGIVQGVSALEDGSGYKITISQYFTANGIAIHQKGVEPDYEVPYEGRINYETPDLENDLQLIKAIEVLKEKLMSK
ncbi:MAG: S41 family peptidase [Clostridia bacterium]|nr:S41 family peptidase [Clostridia bacterium]